MSETPLQHVKIGNTGEGRLAIFERIRHPYAADALEPLQYVPVTPGVSPEFLASALAKRWEAHLAGIYERRERR